VRVEGESLLDAEAVHQYERDAIGEGEALVWSPLKVFEGGAQQILVDVNQPDGGAAQQTSPEVYSLCVPSSAREKRHRLIQHETRRHQLRWIPKELKPVFDRDRMVLVVDGFDRDEIARIEEDRAQP
jgi:hypothetical protein